MKIPDNYVPPKFLKAILNRNFLVSFGSRVYREEPTNSTGVNLKEALITLLNYVKAISMVLMGRVTFE